MEKRTADEVVKSVALDQDSHTQVYRFPHFDVDEAEWFVSDTIAMGEVGEGLIYRHRHSGRPLVIVYSETQRHYVLYFQVTPDLPIGTRVLLERASEAVPVYIDQISDRYAAPPLGEIPERECDAVQTLFLDQLRSVEPAKEVVMATPTVERVIVRAKRRRGHQTNAGSK
jgi:hypothetical protein